MPISSDTLMDALLCYLEILTAWARSLASSGVHRVSTIANGECPATLPGSAQPNPPYRSEKSAASTMVAMKLAQPWRVTTMAPQALPSLALRRQSQPALRP